MMLMTKFGNFKLRIVATIPLSVIVCILNLVSASTSYWVKYTEGDSVPHMAGLWRSCPANQQGFVNCMWQNGIVSGMHSTWAVCVRVLMGLGLIGNVVAVVCFCCACYYKTIKRSKMAIKMMEWGNMLLICSFMGILIGFGMFISNNWNYSMWFHVAGMCLITVCCNMLVRTFGRLYFMNARGGCPSGAKKAAGAGGVETGCVTGTAEEKAALTASAVCDKETCTGNGELQMTAIEMNKICEKNGSNEALLPNTTATVQPAVNLTDASPVKPAGN